MDLSEIKTWTILHMMLGITFICSGILLNFIQFIFFITIRPFSKDLFRKVNYYLLYSSWSQIVFLAEWWSASDLKFHVAPEHAKYFGKEHALLIMNHNYDVEWVMGWVVGERHSVLGNCRVYAKKVLKYVPVIGWSWALSDIIFVERDWSKDSVNLINSLNELYSYQKTVWILIFCEGTRFTKEKHEISLKFAKERGLPLLKHHLLPRTKGFVFSAKHLKNKFPALYDITIGFSPDHAVPSLKNMLFGKKMQADLYVRITVSCNHGWLSQRQSRLSRFSKFIHSLNSLTSNLIHCDCRRIPFEEIPTDSDEECNKYLYNLYVEKDKFLGDYLSTGKFPVEPIKLDRSFCTLINELFWLCAIMIPSFYFLYQIVVYGSYFMVFCAIAVIFCFYLAVNRLLAVSDHKSGSSYGKTSKQTQASVNPDVKKEN